MKTIDILKVIAKADLNFNEVATQLFPGNKSPYHALKRIVDQDFYLNEMQISKLACMAGCSVDDLYDKVWKSKIICGKSLLKFTSGDYSAVLDPKTGVTRLFCSLTLFHETIITTKATPLHEFIDELQKLVDSHKNK